jgi:hypothetical protein
MGTDGGAPDSTRYPGAVMVWQGPGGFAGTGPAIRVLSNGTVEIWNGVSQFEPDGPVPSPDTTRRLSIAQTDDLFTRWFNTPTPGLPHRVPGGGDCYPRVYTRLCRDCTPRTIQYNVPDALLPEMENVWVWFDTNVPEFNPRRICL